jgi:hypothetical protein
MNASLSVNVKLDMQGQDLTGGTQVIGNIYPADPSGVGHRNVLFPCGGTVHRARYEVPAGRYVVSATLPSGVVLSEDAEACEGTDTHVSLKPDDSPHETHAWQYLMGNVEPEAVYVSPETIPVPRSLGSRYADWEADGPAEAARAVWVDAPEPESHQFSALLRLIDESDTPLAMTQITRSKPWLLRPIGGSDRLSHLYRFGEHGPVDVNDRLIRDRPAGQRQFLVVSLAGNEYLVTLPVPWRQSLAEVLVNTRQSPTGSPISVAVRDGQVGSALGYMARGALESAATLVKDAESMLYDKVSNPLAAAAGAYILIGTELTNRPMRWDPWLDNLRQWFPWMSDGSITWAMRRLRSAKSDDHLKEARNSLLEAFDRGVPFYTLGLGRLIEGLSEFEHDPECAWRLDQARRLSWRVDMREPFVIIGLRRSRP